VTLPAEPIFFKPICKETLWGGCALRTRFNRPLPPDLPIGESWEIVSHRDDQSMVAAGPLAGVTLDRLVAEHPRELLGKIETFGKFPLLYKFIDARDRLSVQVHPDDAQARAGGWGEFGKTECWYVVDAPENGRIITGFARDVTIEEVRKAIETSSLHELLNFNPIKAGDVLFIPAGTVHAILEGACIYEVQETSDTTLRLYDWGRVDAQGKPRPLHVHDALTIIDTAAHEGCSIAPVSFQTRGYGHSYRVACRYFALEQFDFSRDDEVILSARQSFRVLTVLSGRVHLHYPSGSSDVPLGATTLLPAVLRDVRVHGSAGTRIMVSWVPDLQNDIITPLQTLGVPDEAIERLGGFRQRNDLSRFLRREKGASGR
jgi:mannose-6-phosphate isomerase